MSLLNAAAGIRGSKVWVCAERKQMLDLVVILAEVLTSASKVGVKEPLKMPAEWLGRLSHEVVISITFIYAALVLLRLSACSQGAEPLPELEWGLQGWCRLSAPSLLSPPPSPRSPVPVTLPLSLPFSLSFACLPSVSRSHTDTQTHTHTLSLSPSPCL